MKPHAAVPTVVTVLLLLSSLALATDPPAPTVVRDRDRVHGTLPAAGSEVGLALEVLAGSEITLKVKAVSGSFVEPEILLFDPTGEPVDPVGHVRHTAGSTKTKLRKLIVTSTGTHLVVIRALANRIGAFDLKARLKHPEKVKASGEVVAPDGTSLVAFPGFERSMLDVKVKGRRGFLPKADTLLAPAAQTLELSAVEIRGELVRSRGFEIPATGDYRLRIESRDSSTGAWKGRIKLAHPAEEPREVTIEGEPKGTWTGGGSGGGGGQPPPPPPPPPVKIEWRLLNSGYGTGITTKLETDARTQKDYEGLWNQHKLFGSPPTVDFDKEMVVAVFLGNRPMREVIVVSVDSKGDGVEVVYEDRLDPRQYFVPPPPYPHAFIAVTKVDGTVTFRGSVK